jgi:hypothetical protein
MFLCNKLDLDKSPIIQKYYCHKMNNQNILFFCVTLHSTMRMFHLNFWDFKKKVKEIEMNKLDKI